MIMYHKPIATICYYHILGSFTEENICEFGGFWNNRKCFLAIIFYLLIILTKTCIVDSHHHLIVLFKYSKHKKSKEKS